MTTRRSRLKAVANLPVRRKAPALQENSENVARDLGNLSTNTPAGAGKKEGNSVLSTICHENEQIKALPNLGNKISSDSDCDSKSDVSKKSTITEPLLQNSNIVNSLVSNDKVMRKEMVQDNPTDNAILMLGDNKFASSLVLSVTNEKNSHDGSTANDENQCSTIQKSIICEIPVNEKEYDIHNKNPKIFTVEISKDSITSIEDTQFIVCENDNSCRNVFSTNSNEIILDTDISESVLTTLVGSVNKNSAIINNSKNSEDLNLLASQKESLISTICKDTAVLEIINYENECLPKSILNPIRDKLSEENTIYQESQDIIVSNINTTTKRNIAAVKRKRSKCSDFTKKLADARREFQKKYENTKPDRSTLKMIDLIFYNPATNPMESKNKTDKKETLTEAGLIQDPLIEEEVDEPQSFDLTKSLDNDGNNLRMPAPQVKIGLNGEIILDEKSIVIETTEAKRSREDLIKNSVPVFEERGSRVSYYRRKTKKTRDWTDFETKRFYKALNTIGPDFSLMQKYFPKRSRMELKNKFKREERLNRSLIDKALINPSEFDMTQLEKDLAVEEIAEEREIEMKIVREMKEKPAAKRPRTKSSLFGREVIANGENNSTKIIVNGVGSKNITQIEKEKKEKEIGSILRRYLLKDMKQELNDNSGLPPSCVP
ncbi:hypothetical protein RUM43_004661 [Polyplax serrata]|uniref:Myb-like domain-containing protein n=1 Tax=Polyplax serrata TaxID=468196 RepID=A0AAN8SB22_POLSC